MAQSIWSTINPATTSGTQLATLLNDFKEAVVSGLSGTSRPTELDAGGGWIDTTNAGSPNFYWSYKVYTGTVDVEVFRVDLVTNKASISSSNSTFEISKISADAVPALLSFVKERIANSGQVLEDDVVGELRFTGGANDASSPVVASMKIVANEDMTATESGVMFVWESTPEGSITASEQMRLVNGFLGIGTQAPDSVVHADGATGIKSSVEVDGTAPALVKLQKGRIAGDGAVEDNDGIGSVEFYAQDQGTTYDKVASIDLVATEEHTVSAKGTELSVKTTNVGASTPTEKMLIADEVETKVNHILNALELVSQNVATTATINQLNADKAVVEFTGSTATSVRGINSAGVSKTILIHNRSTANVRFEHEDTNATAADRLKLPGGIFIEIAPDESIEFYYCDDESRFKLKSGSGLGSGGEGVPNYVENGNFEEGNISNVATYADADQATPVDGTGGSPAGVTVSLNTTTPLKGSYSLIIAKDAADRRGEGGSINFSVSETDKAKVMKVRFDYKVKSGTFVAATNSAIGDIQIFVYDVTNAALVGISSSKLFSNSSTISDVFEAEFQTASNSTSYRLIYHVATESTAAFELEVDEIVISRSEYVFGTPISDWTSYVPTGTFTNTTYSGRWRRLGDSAHVIVQGVLTGTPGAANLNVNLPSGMSVDLTKLLTGITACPVGEGSIVDNGSDTYGIVVDVDGSGNIRAVTNRTVSHTGAVPLQQSQPVTNAIPYSFVSGDGFVMNFVVPIVGWSSSVQMSDRADTRLLTVDYTASGSQTVASGGTGTVLFSTKVDDSHGAFNAGTGTFTAPHSGYFEATYYNSMSSAGTTGYFGIDIRFNGVSVVRQEAITASARRIFTITSGAHYLQAGQTITCFADNQTGGTATFGTSTRINIRSCKGPSAIAATETISFFAVRGTNQTGVNPNNSAVKLLFNSVTDDTHGNFNTTDSRYVVQTAGRYNFNIGAYFAGNNILQARYRVDLYKNGSLFLRGHVESVDSAGVEQLFSSTFMSIKANAGDYFEVYLLGYGNNSSSTLTLQALEGTYFAGQRIGL